MATVVLEQGTVEYLLFTWTDLLNVVTTLDGITLKYDVKSTSTPFSYYTDAPATNVGMTQYCLIDTTSSPSGSPSTGGLWLPDTYKIWVKATAGLGLEKPRSTSFSFTVQV